MDRKMNTSNMSEVAAVASLWGLLLRELMKQGKAHTLDRLDAVVAGKAKVLFAMQVSGNQADIVGEIASEGGSPEQVFHEVVDLQPFDLDKAH